MPYSFLVFDFGTNEDAAQQARHRIEGWKQGFRLDKKLQVKFERESVSAPEPAASSSAKATKPASKGKGKTGEKAKLADKSDSKPAPAESSQIRLIVRLDFSDHEKLSHQRWLERIPAEEPFKNANPKVVRSGEADFTATSELFDSLD